jgi:Fe-S-cluster containining protein
MHAPPLPEEAQLEMHKGYEALLAALEETAHCQGSDGRIVVTRAFIDHFQAWWDHYERFLTLVSPAFKPPCQAGCNHCCKGDPRGVSGIELTWLHQLVRGRDDAFAVRGRARRLARQVDALTGEHGDRQGYIEVEKAAQGCMFLDHKGWCSVYAARPVACRMFFAVTPAELCDAQHPQHEQAINPHLVPSETHRGVLLAISERLGLGDLPTDLRRGYAALTERDTP